MRVFEAVACGSLLLINDLVGNGHGELFRDGVHLATYREADELLDKAAYDLGRETLRERIAAPGVAEATARHSDRHRMERLLRDVGTVRATTVIRPAVDGLPHEADSRCDRDDQDRSHFEHARPEVLALIPDAARRVLEVGCGAGRLGEALKARQPARVTGVELVSQAAEIARTRLDEVFIGDVEARELPFATGSFDCIVCGDVIEHLREPWRFLRRVRAWLDPGGRVVVSLPNVRHYTVVSSLLEGNWTYESAGLLDETHLSFFTRSDMIDLFECCGFRVEDVRGVPGPGYDEWCRLGCPGEVRVGRLHFADLPPEEAEEFFIYQYLLVARPREGFEADTVGGSGRGSHDKQGHVPVVVDRAPLVEPENGTACAAAPVMTTIRRESLARADVRSLRLAFLGNFEQPWSTEQYAADALEHIGHAVHRIHEYAVASAAEVVQRIESF